MKQFINKLKEKLAGTQWLDHPTEEGFLLWPDTADAPLEKVRMSGDERLVTNVNRPAIVFYPAAAEHATGAAMIIAPGGSHRELWIDHEGHRPAQWLSERGVAAFVLKYRLGQEASSAYSVGPLGGMGHRYRKDRRDGVLSRGRAGGACGNAL
jgi:acetyl esterase/lipase